MAGAKDDYEATWGGEKLFAEPKELFFAPPRREPRGHHPPRVPGPAARGGLRSRLRGVHNLGRHEFFAWRAYDNKKVYALNELPSKKLRDAFAPERKRDGATSKPPLRERKKREEEDDDEDWDPSFSNDDLRQLCCPQVPRGGTTRTASPASSTASSRALSILNGKRSPTSEGRRRQAGVAAVPAGQEGRQDRIAEYTLQVQTHLGTRLVGLDALSNEAPQDAEPARFRVPLDPREVRQKLSAPSARWRTTGTLREADIRRRQEAEERFARSATRKEQRKLEAEERERRERERDEVRQRAAAQKAQDNDQWWLSYGNANDFKATRARAEARLKRFNTIATSSGAEGERENVRRLAEQAQAKIDRSRSSRPTTTRRPTATTRRSSGGGGGDGGGGMAPAPAPAEEEARWRRRRPPRRRRRRRRRRRKCRRRWRRRRRRRRLSRRRRTCSGPTATRRRVSDGSISVI